MEFKNSYKNLSDAFYQEISPTPVKEPKLIKFNSDLAKELKIEIKDADLYFSGNKLFNGSEPIAQAYAGHQFGSFVPQLGDGRAILLGELIDIHGQKRDLQLKGSGRTKFSRGGDGRAWLGPVMREYLVSEAMHKLNIPTTRALAAVETGEEIYRDQALPGAILTRVAKSHIRVGTFEYFAYQGELKLLEELVDHVIEFHYPEISNSENKFLALIEAISKKQAQLIAAWMSIGFIHGVMNTDNTSITGETIDYGPCAFMDFYDPKTVFSSIDHYGRYAYQNQTSIAFWNLGCLANTLIPLIDKDENKAIELVKQSIEVFKLEFEANFSEKLYSKLGIFNKKDEDEKLLESFIALMQSNKADFTLSFRFLTDILSANDKSRFVDLFEDKEGLDDWLNAWQQRLASEDHLELSEKMNKINPIYIPRNFLVEEMIEKAHLEKDFSYFEKLLAVLEEPFIEKPELESYAYAPQQKESQYQTFCGT
jgi:uncharacterized protein YdiU (UPF0061 family)